MLSKVIKQTQFYVTLRRTSNSQELAKIDPDTGLQEIVGPSANKVISVSAQRNFPIGAIYVSYAQADARDALTGKPIPEAPRFIWDTVGSLTKLPLRLQVRAEYEYVRAKPLGDGFVGVPVTEFRGAVLRPFLENRISIAANVLVASGLRADDRSARVPARCCPGGASRRRSAQVLYQCQLHLLLQEVNILPVSLFRPAVSSLPDSCFWPLGGRTA